MPTSLCLLQIGQEKYINVLIPRWFENVRSTEEANRNMSLCLTSGKWDVILATLQHFQLKLDEGTLLNFDSIQLEVS